MGDYAGDQGGFVLFLILILLVLGFMNGGLYSVDK